MITSTTISWLDSVTPVFTLSARIPADVQYLSATMARAAYLTILYAPLIATALLAYVSHRFRILWFWLLSSAVAKGGPVRQNSS